MVLNENTAKLFVFSSLGFGVLANYFAAISCDLLEYDVPSDVGGTLGLFRYGVQGDNYDECFRFGDDTQEDSTFGPARIGVMLSMCLGLLLFGLNVVHYGYFAIPHKETLFYVLGGCIQLSLGLIYTMWKNELCETYGCRMGAGSSWNGLAHVMYLGATVVNLFIGEPQYNKGRPEPMQQMQRMLYQ
eukprot:Nitzschia sp. Nitz4//scaffold28_size193895//27190//27835//NITZ4_001628-RA/size193895-augustus-gene-0.301-mRNA-1//-1//CDS//3329545871//6704//frame0